MRSLSSLLVTKLLRPPLTLQSAIQIVLLVFVPLFAFPTRTKKEKSVRTVKNCVGLYTHPKRQKEKVIKKGKQTYRFEFHRTNFIKYFNKHR